MKCLCCKVPRWCLGIMLFGRATSFALTLVLYVLAMLSRCIYFQFWKTYDVFFLFLHFFIACCLVTLRKDDVIWRLHLIRKRMEYKEKEFLKQVEREKDECQKDNVQQHDDDPAVVGLDGIYPTIQDENDPNTIPTIQVEGDQNDQNTSQPSPRCINEGTPLDTIDTDAKDSSMLDDFGEFGIKIVNRIKSFRDDPRSLKELRAQIPDPRTLKEKILFEIRSFLTSVWEVGKASLKRAEKEPEDQDDSDEDKEPDEPAEPPPPMWQVKLASALHLGIQTLRFRVSIALLLGLFSKATSDSAEGSQLILLLRGLWIHIPLMWMQFIFSIYRQFRLWCRLGCARYYLWLVCLVTCGICLIELPYYYLRLNLDHTKCFFQVDEIDKHKPWCSMFACLDKYGREE